MMNKESLEKMSRMRLLGMHQAFKACIESEKTETFTNCNYKVASGRGRFTVII